MPVTTFDLVRKTIPLRLKHTDGTISDCVLQEMDGTVRDKFVAAISSKAKTSKTGDVEFDSHEGIQAKLISLHLHYATIKENDEVEAIGERVSESVVQSFPASLQNRLMKMCQELSGIGVDSKDEEGNDL